MNILSAIFWVRRKLNQSTWPDHICHQIVQREWSNYVTFKNLNDIFAVL